MLLRVFLFLALSVLPVRAEMATFPAIDPQAPPERMVVYSTLDTRLAAPLVQAYQRQRPGLTIVYEDSLAADIAHRVMAETNAGQITADFVFSSGMDWQMKLANDGYAQAVSVPNAAAWPRWANWRDTAFALTFEPAVLVYHRPSFPDGPPLSRLKLIEWLAGTQPAPQGRIGTYDIERSSVGYLYLVRDAEHFADIWSLLRAMARVGLRTYPTSQDIIDRVADGRLMLGYNILGSYAADQARLRPDLGQVQLSDFTVVVSRVGLVPTAAASPDLGAGFLAFLMGKEGQALLAEGLHLPTSGVSAQSGQTGALRPVAVSPGLLAYLDQAKRRGIVARWRTALGLAN